MDTLPAYSKQPTDFTPIQDKSPPDYSVQDAVTKQQDVEMEVFITRWRPLSDKAKKFQPNGTLFIGTKSVTNVLDHAVLFQPFNDSKDTSRHDLSHTITVEKLDNDVLRYHKGLDSTSPYTFQIDISDFATGKAKFNGTLTKGSEVYDWRGEWFSKSTVQVVATIDSIERPASAKSGSLAQLDAITPIAHIGQGVGEDALKADQDAAQYYGDKILHKIMMHSLEGTSADPLIGKQQPLDQAESEILAANTDFFQRGAVHTLCEQIKTIKGLDSKYADHIKWKYNFYLKMLASPKKPRAGQWDPVSLYGLDRNTDAELIAKLQSQYQNATMACYELGYKRQCPEWEDYMQNPDYWFKAYQQRLLSEEQIKKWVTASINSNSSASGQISGEDQVRIWSNKLSLLKHAAQTQGKDKPEFNIEKISNVLLGRLHQESAYLQLVNNDLVEKSNQLFEKMDATSLTDAFKKNMQNMDDAAKQSAAELQSTMPHIIALLANTQSDMHMKIREYWDARIPGGAPTDLTMGQMAEGVEMMPLKESLAADKVSMQLDGQTNEIIQINKKGGRWTKIGQIAGKTLKVLFKAALHGAAIFFLYAFFAGDQSHVSVSEMGTAICAAVTEGVAIVGKGIGKLLSLGKALNWAVAEKGVYRTATAWFTKTMKAGEGVAAKLLASFVGDLGKVIRTLGLAGCIFMLVTSYWGMNAAGDSNNPNIQNERYFSKWYFALGVVEGVAIIGSIAAEILGYTTVAAVCGPLALIAGVAALVVLIVQLCAFPPNPWAAVEAFLKGLPTDFGSYNPNTEEKNDWLTTLKRSDITFEPTALKIQHEPQDESQDEIQPDVDAEPELAPQNRLITDTQHTAARALEEFVQSYIDILKLVTTSSSALEELLEAFNQELGMITVGNLWQPAFQAFTQATQTLTQSWDVQVQNLVGITQYPAYIRDGLQQGGDSLRTACEVLNTAMIGDI